MTMLEDSSIQKGAQPRMIDCHNHILADIDDGAVDMGMSLAMAKVSVDCGVSDVVVTPHHGNGAFENFAQTVRQEMQNLQMELIKHKLPLRLHLGSELHLTAEMNGQIERGEVLTYANKGKAALIELPKSHLPAGIEALLGRCLDQGVTPLIAHPERNSELARQPEKFVEWVEWGCRGQLTALSVSGYFGEKIQAACDYWITNKAAHVVASDAHRPKGRSPNLLKAYHYVADHYGTEIASVLFYTNPQHLITGQPLITLPTVSNRRANLLHREGAKSNQQRKAKQPSLFARLFGKQ